jgi:hypothetical protein
MIAKKMSTEIYEGCPFWSKLSFNNSNSIAFLLKNEIGQVEIRISEISLPCTTRDREGR